MLPQTLVLIFHPDKPNSPRLPKLHGRGTGVLEPWHKHGGVWAFLLIVLPKTGGKLGFTFARSPFMAGPCPPQCVCFPELRHVPAEERDPGGQALVPLNSCYSVHELRF